MMPGTAERVHGFTDPARLAMLTTAVGLGCVSDDGPEPITGRTYAALTAIRQGLLLAGWEGSPGLAVLEGPVDLGEGSAVVAGLRIRDVTALLSLFDLDTWVVSCSSGGVPVASNDFDDFRDAREHFALTVELVAGIAMRGDR